MARLGRDLMDAVGRVVPVALIEDRALTEFDLKAEVRRLLQRLESAEAHVYIPRRDLDYALTVGLRMLRLRRLVEEQDGLFRARQEELPLLRYYGELHRAFHMSHWTTG
jgi:glycerol-3-phosphate O-acyltransferase